MTTTFKWKSGVLRRIRYMPATVALLESKGKPIVSAANNALDADVDDLGYQMASRKGASRHRVSVATVSIASRRHNAKNNTLLRLLGG